jgi:hypothetical protein
MNHFNLFRSGFKKAQSMSFLLPTFKSNIISLNMKFTLKNSIGTLFLIILIHSHPSKADGDEDEPRLGGTQIQNNPIEVRYLPPEEKELRLNEQIDRMVHLRNNVGKELRLIIGRTNT